MSIEERLTAIEEGLARTKRDNRRRKLVNGITTLVVCIALFVTVREGFKPAVKAAADHAMAIAKELPINVKQVIAQSFVLVDENDKILGVIGTTPNGAGILLRDQNGELRAGLILSKDGPMLVECDDNGRNRVIVSTLDNSPAIVLIDPNGKATWRAP
jgi:hypothetical protein